MREIQPVNVEWVKRVKQLMDDIGISTVQDLAYKSGVSSGSLSQALHGKHMPKPVTIEKIAKALGTTAQFLLFGDKGQIINKLPLIESAEELRLWLSGNAIDTTTVDWLEVGELEASPNAYVVTFDNTDMRPFFEPGDRIIFERANEDSLRPLLMKNRNPFVLVLSTETKPFRLLYGYLGHTSDGYIIESPDKKYKAVPVNNENTLVGIAVHQIRTFSELS